jgi:hypothetical protein
MNTELIMHRGKRPSPQPECEWKRESPFIPKQEVGGRRAGKLTTIRPASDELVPAHSRPGPRIMDNFPPAQPRRRMTLQK